MSEASTICMACIGHDPEHCEDDGWRGDCPWLLHLLNDDGSRKTCSYGCWEEPECQTCIPMEGWGESPNGAPCSECGGTGAVPNINIDWDNVRRVRWPHLYAKYNGSRLMNQEVLS